MRKPVSRRTLDSEVIEKIIYSVRELNWSYADVAVKFRVTRFVIGKLIKRLNIDSEFLD